MENAQGKEHKIWTKLRIGSSSNITVVPYVVVKSSNVVAVVVAVRSGIL